MYRGIFAIGEYYHVYNRGNRKEVIFYEEKDMWRFLQILRFFNDSHSSIHFLRNFNLGSSESLSKSGFDNAPETVFELGWPRNLPERNPLVKILCYCLVPNHFHLLLKEIRKDGISKFMQKTGTGFSKYSNIKYQNVGRIFQGPYKIKLVKEQKYLQHLVVYIQLINALELFPGGVEEALKNPKKAMEFADNYIFSSHRDYIGLRRSLIVEKDILEKIFPTPSIYKQFAHQTLLGKILPDRKNIYQFLGNLTLE